MEDAIRDLVRAIRGNAPANEALDRLVAGMNDDGELVGGDYAELRMRNRIAVERAAR